MVLHPYCDRSERSDCSDEEDEGMQEIIDLQKALEYFHLVSERDIERAYNNGEANPAYDKITY